MPDIGCCIAGGGPAGMMLGFLLARQGVEVIVLEKHGDFLRDFRGDTVHPSTLRLLDELGMADEFLELPHQKVGRLVSRPMTAPTSWRTSAVSLGSSRSSRSYRSGTSSTSWPTARGATRISRCGWMQKWSVCFARPDR